MSGSITIIDGSTGEVVELPSVPSAQAQSLDLAPETTFEDWRVIGEHLCRYEKGVQWWIGDWWAFGSARYGERAKLAAEGVFGRAFKTLANCASVARTFETSRRREVLSFNHHAEVASLPAPEAEALLDEAEAERLSTRDLRQRVKQRKNRVGADEATAETCTTADLGTLVANGLRFGTIYADPPWLYDNQTTRAATLNHYEGLTVEELCALPIGELAAPDAHLHLWTTNAFLFECPRIFDAWGFEFKTSFVWVKSQMGIGNYWRNSHEILLTAVRGAAKSFSDHSMMSWIECGRGAHSAKPEQVRGFLERASPGPRLELFGRRPAEGWVVWGNEIERGLFDANIAEVAA